MSEFSQIFDLTAIAVYSPVVIFGALFLATFVSEDLACLTAGALAGQGNISFAAAVAACAAGIFVGDIGLYWTGRIFGKRIVETRLFSRFVSAVALEKASAWLDKNGASAIFLSRFMTGLRLPTYLAAGFLRTNFSKFALYFLIATMIWTPLLVGGAAYAQENVFASIGLIGIVSGFFGLKMILRFSNWKKRRLFIGRLKRIANWEFWSLKVFYFPVVIYILFLAVRHRGINVFTSANPGILAGGFVGESKNDIYKGLASAAAQPFLLKYIFLGAENSVAKNLQKAEQFIAESGLDFPFILKPDAGERGKGVEILKDWFELEKQISRLKQDFILQEFYDGIEASVFYYRYPFEKKGRIFSITEKRFPRLAGDGRATLETLILLDPRAVALAEKYFQQNRERLEYVPENGEEIQIINIGTHSRGAIFADGDHLRTKKLTCRIDEICREFDGFYFGRFDIRAATFDDLKRGENFKIIELNGVTSESTNIYDKKFSLFAAYRILFRQWRIAFEIGAENRRRGFQPTGIFDMIRLIFGKKTGRKTDLPVTV